jgi:Zn-dependent peptidase ImmA (M78 family)
MIEPRSWTSGNQNEFAITLSFATDPDRGRGASTATSASWGSFEIWVNGLNLCLHREDAYTLPAVHWYLLPLLQWFVSNWDELLHEERLPNRNEGRDAWRSLRATVEPPPALSQSEADEWDERQHAWWARHALLACRDGGLFPDIIIRRMQDKVEFSWGCSKTAGAPQHHYFFANQGYARVDPQVVAKHLSFVVGSAIEHLHSEVSDEPAFQALRFAFHSLTTIDRVDKQLSLICGLQSGTRDVLLARNSFRAPWLTPFTSEQRTRLVVAQSPQYCLMFGSFAPDIDEQDVKQLIDVVASIQHPHQENQLLKTLVRDEPIRSALERPWKRGYALAEDLHEALNGRHRKDAMIDVEGLFADLEICVTTVELNDTTIRALAIAGENCRPSVAINSRYKYQDSHPRRFTLAHELCHLLHDRTHGVRLALASGPWAPVDVEKRANAFAAMFLMPPELIQTVVDEENIALDSVKGIWAVSNRLGVSFTAVVEHVCNLGFIDQETRNELKQQAVQNPAAKI